MDARTGTTEWDSLVWPAIILFNAACLIFFGWWYILFCLSLIPVIALAMKYSREDGQETLDAYRAIQQRVRESYEIRPCSLPGSTGVTSCSAETPL